MLSVVLESIPSEEGQWRTSLPYLISLRYLTRCSVLVLLNQWFAPLTTGPMISTWVRIYGVFPRANTGISFFPYEPAGILPQVGPRRDAPNAEANKHPTCLLPTCLLQTSMEVRVLREPASMRAICKICPARSYRPT
jgi:hypothetical protein